LHNFAQTEASLRRTKKWNGMELNDGRGRGRGQRRRLPL